MKSSKKLNPILTIIAIAVWLIIGYKIYSATHKHTAVIKRTENNKSQKKNLIILFTTILKILF